jgi:hypothetical protein
MQHVTEVLKIYPPTNDNERVRLYITMTDKNSAQNFSLVKKSMYNYTFPFMNIMRTYCE